MNPAIIDFINKHEDLIDNDEWHEVYTFAHKELIMLEIGQLTDYLLNAGIHPEEYLTELPEDFLAISDIKEFTIPEGVTSIGNDAFRSCKSLISITIPDSVTYINGKEVFRHLADDFWINCSRGSYAEKYAKENNIPIKYLNESYSLRFKLVESIDDRLKEELDSEGNLLTTEQINYFRNSCVRTGSALKVCYHGSRVSENLTILDPNESHYKAIFFSNSEDLAKLFTYGNDKAVYVCYLNICNPLTIDAKHKDWYSIEFDGGIYDVEQLIKYAKEHSYDGLIIHNIIEHDSYHCDDYIVFKSNQVKRVSNKDPQNTPFLDM